MYVQATSASSINSAAGWATPNFNQLQPPYRPRITADIRTDSPVTNRRLWVALTSASIEALPQAVASTASTLTFVGVGFDTSIGAGWHCCSGDGTNYTCINGPSATVAANTEYTVVVDWTVSGTLTCSVIQAGTLFTVTKNTNLSTANTNLGIEVATTNLAGSSAVVNFTSDVVLEQN
jgi:hypothetical protein